MTTDRAWVDRAKVHQTPQHPRLTLLATSCLSERHSRILFASFGLESANLQSFLNHHCNVASLIEKHLNHIIPTFILRTNDARMVPELTETSQHCSVVKDEPRSAPPSTVRPDPGAGFVGGRIMHKTNLFEEHDTAAYMPTVRFAFFAVIAMP